MPKETGGRRDKPENDRRNKSEISGTGSNRQTNYNYIMQLVELHKLQGVLLRRLATARTEKTAPKTRPDNSSF